MTSSFTSINTLTRALVNQSLVQNTVASNLSKTYRDSDGYVIVSRERVNFAGVPDLTLYTGNGYVNVGQGSSLQSITRLRDFYLDYQIQKQSMTVGREEVLSNMMKQVSSILDSTSGTLNDQLTTLASDFTSLAADPTNLTLRNAVVADGTTFATMANDQYAQLETLQYSLNDEVKNTVTEINALTQQLSSVNQQLSSSTANGPDSLLDARDYALDRLGRLVNFTVSYGTKGTVSVSMNGLSLVNASGAATLSTDTINAHNPSLSDVTYQSPQGTPLNITSQIQGGQLAGYLEARDTTVEGYKNDLDHYVTSVMTVANLLHSSGYGSDGVTTGINFFSGVSARDISVNASIVTDSNRVLLAASSRYGDTANGQVAQFLGTLPDLLTDDRIESFQAMNSGLGKIDPTQAMNSTTNTGLNGNVTSTNSTNFSTIPSAGGIFTVNSTNVTYTSGQSIYTILDNINASDPNVEAVFNYKTQKIYIVSNNTVNIKSVAGNVFGFAGLRNLVSSTIRMNNGFTPQDLAIDAGSPVYSAVTSPLDSANNTQAFKVTPSTSGSFQVNIYDNVTGITKTVTINWTNKQSLLGPGSIGAALIAAVGRPTFQVSFDPNTQQLILKDETPISITDLTGNFTTFTGMNGSPRIGNMGAGIAAEASDDYDAATTLTNTAQSSLDQLNNAQADVAAISYSGTDSSSSSSSTTTETESGTPYETELANSVKSMIAYNAALQAMAIQEKMLSDLISIVSGSGSSTSISFGQNS
jgi:flagellar hook-associated protein 1 FlgK